MIKIVLIRYICCSGVQY